MSENNTNEGGLASAKRHHREIYHLVVLNEP